MSLIRGSPQACFHSQYLAGQMRYCIFYSTHIQKKSSVMSMAYDEYDGKLIYMSFFMHSQFNNVKYSSIVGCDGHTVLLFLT